jgi:hypothetical protein
MTMTRAQLVDVSIARWYHSVTPCLRRAHFLGEGDYSRKDWIGSRLEELAEIFAVAVGGFSMVDKPEISRKGAKPQSCRRVEETNERSHESTWGN